MNFFQIAERSKANPAQALKASLQRAIERKKDASHTHIYLKNIVESRKNGELEWVAHLNVVTEPKIPYVRPVHKPQYIFKQQGSPESPQEECSRKEHDRHMREEQDIRHHDDLERVNLHRASVNYELVEDYEFLLMYLETRYEDTFNAIAPAFKFDAVHVMASDQLMLEAERRHPDMALHSATREQSDDGKPPESDELLPPSMDDTVKFKPGKKDRKLENTYE